MKFKNTLVAGAAALALGLGGAAVSVVPASAGQAHPCYAKTIYGNGPGKGIFSQNYRAYDAWCNEDGEYGDEWWGPWRLKKSSAQADAKRHNARFN